VFVNGFILLANYTCLLMILCDVIL